MRLGRDERGRGMVKDSRAVDLPLAADAGAPERWVSVIASDGGASEDRKGEYGGGGEGSAIRFERDQAGALDGPGVSWAVAANGRRRDAPFGPVGERVRERGGGHLARRG